MVALTAAALTNSGLLLVVIVGGIAILAFLLFVLREAFTHPVELPRELPPPHDLPSREGDAVAASAPLTGAPGQPSDGSPPIGG